MARVRRVKNLKLIVTNKEEKRMNNVKKKAEITTEIWSDRSRAKLLGAGTIA